MKVKVWDLPTRLFHWLLVALFAGMWFSGEQGGGWLEWHIRGGVLVGILVLFRVVWGFAGSETARFSDFVHGPATIRNYLATQKSPTLGHNPLGALMVLALLLFLALQFGTGLFARDLDSYLYNGPLSHLTSDDLGETLTGIHKKLFDILLILVALHLAAIVLYKKVKKQDLVPAMLTGRKEVAEGRDAVMVSPLRALLVLAACAAVVLGVLTYL